MQEKRVPSQSPLRPLYLEYFTGQEKIIERLSILIQAAKKRKDPLGHTLFSGPPGLGKTTLAQILAREMGANIVITSGPVLEKPGDLAGILTKMQEGDVLFIDEIHRLSRNIEEYLYPAMEDFTIDLLIDSGPNARSVPLSIPPFTLIGATTKAGLLTKPLLTRFSQHMRLEYYPVAYLMTIALRTAETLCFSLDEKSAEAIAQRSRGTPRILNHLVHWVRDYAMIHHEGNVSFPVTEKALEMLTIDEKGLDEMDKKILTVMLEHHNGGPVGLNTLASAVGEEPTTVAEVYEPFLVLQGLIRRTPRGRELTHLAYQHLRAPSPSKKQNDCSGEIS